MSDLPTEADRAALASIREALERLARKLLLAPASPAEVSEALMELAAPSLDGMPAAIVLIPAGEVCPVVLAARDLDPEAFSPHDWLAEEEVAQAMSTASRVVLAPADLGVDAAESARLHLLPLSIDGPASTFEGAPPQVLHALVALAPGPGPLAPTCEALFRVLGSQGAMLLANARLHESVRTSEQTYLTLVERAELGMALADSDRRLQHINGPLSELTGGLARPGGLLIELIVPEDRPTVTAHMQSRLEGHGDAVEVHVTGARGPVAARILATPLLDGGDRLSGWVLIVRDRTGELALEEERQQLASRVQQAEKLSAVGQFVAGIAHELNNPLTVVIGYAELLHETAPLPAHHRASVEQVLTHARRCGRIVEDLLKFAHHERIRPEPVHLSQVIRESLAAVTPRKSGDVTFVVDVPPDLPPLVGSQHALTQVVTNIVDNAADAVHMTAGEHRVSIRVTRTDGYQQIEVTDTGPGIPDTVRMFDPFYTTKPIGKGTGLGLSICYGIVHEHDGELYAENLPGGEGARLIVRLPEAKRTEVELPALPGFGDAVDAPLHFDHRPRLLVVDDEPAILSLTSRSLARWCDVVSAETVEEAVRVLEHDHFDAILTDLRLPAGLTGADFYEILVERWPDLVERLAFMTGDTIGQASQAFLDRVRRPCLTKPFKISQLKAFVQALVKSDEG
ncbi:MAG: response regulator [Deltaproteobacteria bacterium]|nr:response regulator [Deltaproteobacteria bacterium]MCB9788175.1 response regulator [Deltaproteobacteria bacterium]